MLINLEIFSKAILFLLIFITQVSCFHEDTPAGTTVSEWSDELRMKKIEDINESDDVVEINLEAKISEVALMDGQKTVMYTYNGIFPGPMIEAKVGDTLVVNFTNNLPEETTVHWHGLELPANMDGSNISQLPVAANGGTFTYRFKLLNAATYWYHPHQATHRQIEMGLQGALIVRDPAEDEALGLPEKELTLILDDILLDGNNQISPAYPLDPVEYATTQINGREGNVTLINGKRWPITIDVKAGEPIRLRLINTANSRFFRVSVPNHLLFRIGGDAGLIAETETKYPIEILVDPSTFGSRDVGDITGDVSDPDTSLGVMLVPGERAEIVFTPKGELDDSIYLEWHDYPRGKHSAFRQDDGTIGLQTAIQSDGGLTPERLIRFRINEVNEAFATDYIPPLNLRSVSPIDVSSALGVLPVTFGHSLPDLNGEITFFATMVDGVGKPFSQLLPEEGLQATVNGTYIWEVKNLTEGDHPFHPHGFTFQPIETEYVDLDNAQNNYIEKALKIEDKDTINIPGRPGSVRGRSWTISRLAVTFSNIDRVGQISASGKVATEDTSGGWVVHCHILEHANRGMMTFLNLTP